MRPVRKLANLPPPSNASQAKVIRPTGTERLRTNLRTDPSAVSAEKTPCSKEGHVPVLNRFRKYIIALFKLGHIARTAKTAQRTALQTAAKSEELHAVLAQKLDALSENTHHAISEMDARLAEHTTWINGRLAEHSLHDSELSRRLDRILMNRASLVSSSTPEASDSGLTDTSEGLELFLDTFYHRLENRLRGSYEDILNRLAVYQPDIETAAIRTGRKPVLDLGCGRGEWLELMRRLDIPASGVDLNAVQMAEARDAGLAVEELDARTALANADDESLSVISAHHLIEHIPFRDVAWIAREALRVLAPGGLLIFETPNVRNVIVGATSFHNDPTHLRPLTDSVLGVLFETAGYHPVETRFLHPHARMDEFINRPEFDPELAHLLFGPQDLAMIGQKPRETS